MLKVISGDRQFVVEKEEGSAGLKTINGEPFEWDLEKIRPGHYHIVRNNKSFRVEVLKADLESKAFDLKVNSQLYQFTVKDRFDELLEKMGLDSLATAKVSEIKAPMPGLVLDIVVEAGTAVAKGDPLIVLEAMKMENILKSPTDGVIKDIKVKKGVAVEKNEVILNFA